ncbi:Ftr1 protein [Leucosporidium creatinivorum]|uniref:Ftr1 protein n=1 Tax=Leucosporidium creatinivorum TaxID=106004 RepID=A0A1Y2FZN0_9BASI|nr:Ftr1 protein [Leucosporidium creatinivorum]
MGNVFSVPIFFIVFRETIEAAIIISVLLGLVENLVDKTEVVSTEKAAEDDETMANRKRLIKRMRMLIWAGALLGLFIALCIGAAFIAVFFTTLSDIWSKSEEIWEGTFSLIASLIIYVMGITMLRIDRSKLKWKIKLEGAFDKKPHEELTDKERKEGRSGKWTLFILPLVTVLREGLEAVVFVGGVSLGQSAKSIPLAAIVGLICGLVIGYLIYASGSRVNLSIFLIVSTNILFLLGSGLFSKAVLFYQINAFNNGVGADVEELGLGPGSYDVRGNVWHLTWGNPENNLSGQGWSIFNAILGWTNSATLGSILSYCFYWFAVIAGLVYMKWSEGRSSLFGYHSAAGLRRQEKAAALAKAEGSSTTSEKTKESDDKIKDIEEARPTLNHAGESALSTGSEEIKASA